MSSLEDNVKDLIILEGNAEDAYARAEIIAKNGFDSKRTMIAYYHHGWGRRDCITIYPIGKGKVPVLINREEEGIYFVRNPDSSKVEAVSLRDISYNKTIIGMTLFFNFLRGIQLNLLRRYLKWFDE